MKININQVDSDAQALVLSNDITGITEVIFY